VTISNETKVGAIAAVAITILILGYNYLKGNELFTHTLTLYAKYPRINGLTPSDPVIYRGFNIGRVAKIFIDQDEPDKILVEFDINKELDIPVNSIAKIVSSDLLGAKAIEIIFGDLNDYVENQDTLIPAIQPSLSDAIDMQIAPLKLKVVALIASFDTVLTTISYLFNEENISNIDKSLTRLQTTLKALSSSTIRVDTMLAQEGVISKILRNIESITHNLKALNPQITAAVKNFSAVSDSLAATNIYQTINNAEKALDKFSMLMHKINIGEGSLGLLINDKGFYQQLEEATKNLASLLDDMEKYPSRYVNFSVFSKRDPIEKKNRREQRRGQRIVNSDE